LQICAELWRVLAQTCDLMLVARRYLGIKDNLRRLTLSAPAFNWLWTPWHSDLG
jgi:hypothetical protein